MQTLDIQNLIQKAQDLVHDGKIDMAACAVIPIQRIEDENGGYEILLVAKRKTINAVDLAKMIEEM